MQKPALPKLGMCGFSLVEHSGGLHRPIQADQPATRKRSASSMKGLSPKPFSFEPKGICARSFHDAGTFHSRATTPSISGL
ncbi:hypothetical protein D3C87_1945640 [compost metagenome]